MKYTTQPTPHLTEPCNPLTLREKYAHKGGAMVQTCGWQTMAAYSIWWESLLRNPDELVTITVKWKCFSFGQCASDPGSGLGTFSMFKVTSFQLLNVKS